jgi:hypothetical protein
VTRNDDDDNNNNPTLAKNEYVIRHDKVCTYLHYSICKKLGIYIAENWYSHIPNPVTEDEDTTVLWNQGIQTDREVLANRPDITVKNKKDKTCLLIDVAIPSDKNVIQKGAEKKLKYKNGLTSLILKLTPLDACPSNMLSWILEDFT